MHKEVFDAVVEEQMDMCSRTLIKKAGEYAVDTDRLHNFKVAAALQGVSTRQALAGMMAKHTVSIYDMCKDGSYSRELWEEKITDHLNYLFLLAAVVAEDIADEELDPTSPVSGISFAEAAENARENLAKIFEPYSEVIHPDVLPD